jgi:RNA polymerase sigma-70 factor (ECF subfamily)
MSDGDIELLSRWRDGDNSAGTELFSRHHRSVLRVFRFKADDALEDLVQHTFLSCVEEQHRLRDAASFRAFLLGIARNHLLRYFERRAGPRGRVDPLVSAVADFAPSPSTLVHQAAERTRLHRALALLPIDQQLAIELHYWEDLSGSELATVLGVAEGTVRSRLRLAKRRLRELLSDTDADGQASAEREDLGAWANELRSMRDVDDT